MIDEILNPTWLINELFGSVWIFLAVMSIAFFAIAARKKFSFQTTVMDYVFILLAFGLLFQSIQTWIPFIIVIVGIIAGSIFARFIKKE